MVVPARKFVSKDVWWSEEDNLGSGWPSLDEAFISVEETLLGGGESSLDN